jgi:hypothetical protein
MQNIKIVDKKNVIPIRITYFCPTVIASFRRIP